MAHEIIRFKEQYLDKPHLIHPTELDKLFNYIDTRNEGEFYKLAVEGQRIANAQSKSELSETDIAVISVEGTLTYQSTFWQSLCGGTSYQSLMEDFDKVVTDRNINTIVLDVNSGGGEAYGMFELARYMRSKANEKGKKLIAYVDGISASAAYGLSTAADEIIVNPMAEVGSVGVVMRLLNQNKKLEKEGVTQTYVYAGSSKIPYDTEGNFREDFIGDLQEKVNILYEDFTGMVAEFRGIDQQEVKGTEAGMFTAGKSLELGLADAIMTREEFYNYLADLSEGSNMPLNINQLKSKEEETQMSKDTSTADVAVSMEDFQAMQKQLTELTEQNKELTSVAETIKLENAKLEEAAHAKQLAELKDKFSKYSFVDEADKLVELADQMDETAQTLLFSTLDKASLAIDESVSEEMSIEGEAELEVEDKDKEKLATKEAIQAKYTVSN